MRIGAGLSGRWPSDSGASDPPSRPSPDEKHEIVSRISPRVLWAAHGCAIRGETGPVSYHLSSPVREIRLPHHVDDPIF